MKAVLMAIAVIVATMTFMVVFNKSNTHRLDITASNFVANMQSSQSNMN